MTNLIHIPSPYLIYPEPLWANQDITVQDMLAILMQPLDCEKDWRGDSTADCLFQHRLWIASHYWKIHIDKSASIVTIPQHFLPWIKAEVELWNALLKMSRVMQTCGVISSTPLIFTHLVLERHLTLFQFRATKKSKKLTGTEIRKSWQCENAHLRDYANPFTGIVSAPYTRQLIDEAIVMSERLDAFRREIYNPFYRARMALVRSLTDHGLILVRDGKAEHRGRASKK